MHPGRLGCGMFGDYRVTPEERQAWQEEQELRQLHEEISEKVIGCLQEIRGSIIIDRASFKHGDYRITIEVEQ